jgi:hypothetical protein
MCEAKESAASLLGDRGIIRWALAFRWSFRTWLGEVDVGRVAFELVSAFGKTHICDKTEERGAVSPVELYGTDGGYRYLLASYLSSPSHPRAKCACSPFIDCGGKRV